MVHSEIILLEIIKLYVHSSDERVISLDNLEGAFYTLEEILGNNLGISIEYEFYQELEKLELISDDLISCDDEFIYIQDDDIEALEDQVLLSLEDDDLGLDGYISEYVYNICLYKELGIKPPVKDYQELLNLCFTIFKDYQLLALGEKLEGYSSIFRLVKCLVDKYKEIYNNLEFVDTFKIKVVMAYLNDLYLLDSDSDFVNSAWYIILFSKNKEQQYFLGYERLFHSISEEEEEYEEEDDWDFDLDIPSEVTYLDDEISFFVSYYTVLFNDYLKHMEDDDIKSKLNVKKYLLIGIQPDIEEYYLENNTIDTLKLPELKKEWINDNSFTSLYLIASESVDSFNYRDNLVTSDIYADMIIRGLFIRTFLDLCGNKEKREEVKTRIINSNFYKNKDYGIASGVIDDIIFGNRGLELKRNI